MASSGGKRFILRVRPSHTYLLEGDADILSRLLTFEVPSARFSPRFQRREWDGCVKFFERGQARFPTGMLPRVLQGLRMWGHKVAVRRKAYPKPFDPTPQDMLFGIDLRKDQLQCIDQALGKRMGLIDSPTGSGKTAIMAAIAGRLFRERSLTSIILVPGKDLLYQTHEEMEALLGEDITFGILGDSKRSFGNITTQRRERPLLPQPW